MAVCIQLCIIHIETIHSVDEELVRQLACGLSLLAWLRTLCTDRCAWFVYTNTFSLPHIPPPLFLIAEVAWNGQCIGQQYSNIKPKMPVIPLTYYVRIVPFSLFGLSAISLLIITNDCESTSSELLHRAEQKKMPKYHASFFSRHKYHLWHMKNVPSFWANFSFCSRCHCQPVGERATTKNNVRQIDNNESCPGRQINLEMCVISGQQCWGATGKSTHIGARITQHTHTHTRARRA